jgi:hypothetical protein
MLLIISLKRVVVKVLTIGETLKEKYSEEASVGENL